MYSVRPSRSKFSPRRIYSKTAQPRACLAQLAASFFFFVECARRVAGPVSENGLWPTHATSTAAPRPQPGPGPAFLLPAWAQNRSGRSQPLITIRRPGVILGRTKTSAAVSAQTLVSFAIPFPPFTLSSRSGATAAMETTSRRRRELRRRRRAPCRRASSPQAELAAIKRPCGGALCRPSRATVRAPGMASTVLLCRLSAVATAGRAQVGFPGSVLIFLGLGFQC
jgi:hypothetical protein